MTRDTSNCIATTYKYDALNRLTDLDNGSGPSLHYTLEWDCRRTAVTDSVAGTTQYLFDHDGRLLSETPPTGSPKTYVYDNVGNRVSSSGTTWTYDANDRLTSDGTNTYGYDYNGNETTVNGTATDAYDFENHLVSSGSSSYVYDADGNRVQQTVSSTVTNYVLDLSQDLPVVIEERNGSNASVAHYDYGDDLVRMDRGGSAYYYVFDGLGSTRALASSSGTVTDTWTYDAFGNVTRGIGSTVNPYLFNGQCQDGTGLYYLRARYYDPSHGRFLSQDPFGGNDDDPASLHRYLYGHDDPVDRIDPGGKLDTLQVVVTIGIGISLEAEANPAVMSALDEAGSVAEGELLALENQVAPIFESASPQIENATTTAAEGATPLLESASGSVEGQFQEAAESRADSKIVDVALLTVR